VHAKDSAGNLKDSAGNLLAEVDLERVRRREATGCAKRAA
jgi:hypothetical protein